MLEDTEWNHVLKQKGIINGPIKNEIEMTQDQIEEIVDKVLDKAQHGKAMEDCDLDELEGLEDDDLEDNRVLEAYRRQRMSEMKSDQNAKYGSFQQISKTDYNVQVTEASKTETVVLLLHQSGIPASKLIYNHLNRLSTKYKNIKFLHIVATACIENYPDHNVPTLLVYGNGGVLMAQLVGINKLGGLGCTLRDMELLLVGAKVLDMEHVIRLDKEEKKRNGEEESDEEDGWRNRRGIKNNRVALYDDDWN